MNEFSAWSRKHPFYPSLVAITIAATIVVVVGGDGALGEALIPYVLGVVVLALAHRRITKRHGPVPGPYPKPAALVAVAVSGAAFGYAVADTWQAVVQGALTSIAVVWVFHVVARGVGADGFRRRARPAAEEDTSTNDPTQQDDPTDGQPHTERDDESAGPIAAAAIAGIVAVTIVFAKRSENALLALAAIWAVALGVPPVGTYLSRLARRRRRERRNA